MGGWVPCSTLAPYNIDSPRYDDPRFSLDDDLVQAALTAYARAKGFTTYEQLKKKKESGQQIVKNTCTMPHPMGPIGSRCARLSSRNG